MEEIKAKGGTILGKEISLDVDGTRVRVDLSAEIDDKLYLYEVKNGPKAGFTPNQKIAYPLMKQKFPIIPRGGNASTIDIWKVGESFFNYEFEKIIYK